MKTLTALALSIVSLTLTCHAGAIKDLIGTWEGKVTVNVNGETFKERVKIVFKEYGNAGLASKTTMTLPESLKSVETVKFRKNGKIDGVVILGNFGGKEKGTWSSTKRSLTSRTRLTGYPVSQVRKFRLVSKRKMTLTVTSSDGDSEGTKIFGTLKRK